MYMVYMVQMQREKDSRSTLMGGYESLEAQQLLLIADDFPWRQQTDNPSDYIKCSTPITPEFIFHHVRGKNNRLWMRASWKLADDEFVPMSFLLDTGAPKHFYLSERAMRTLEDAGLAIEDTDTDIQFVYAFGRKCPVELTPSAHAPANILGLKMLKRLGLQLFDEEPHFSFNKQFHFFDKSEM